MALSRVRLLETEWALEEMITIVALVTATLPRTILAIPLVNGLMILEVIQLNCQPLSSSPEQLKYWIVDFLFTIAGLLPMPIYKSLI